jgi:hypothetical protein
MRISKEEIHKLTKESRPKVINAEYLDVANKIREYAKIGRFNLRLTHITPEVKDMLIKDGFDVSFAYEYMEYLIEW